MIKKKNKPKFQVMNIGLRKKIERRDRWRKPRADSNKKKMKFRFAGASPRIGYKNAPQVRGLHPCGMPEVLVFNPAELEGVKGCAVRIGSAVGARKAAEIGKAAKAAGLIVLNPRKEKPEKVKETEEAGKETKGEKKELKEPKKLQAKAEI